MYLCCNHIPKSVCYPDVRQYGRNKELQVEAAALGVDLADAGRERQAPVGEDGGRGGNAVAEVGIAACA